MKVVKRIEKSSIELPETPKPIAEYIPAKQSEDKKLDNCQGECLS